MLEKKKEMRQAFFTLILISILAALLAHKYFGIWGLWVAYSVTYIPLSIIHKIVYGNYQTEKDEF